METYALFIDPQLDFCDPSGALFVAGADADMERLAAFVAASGERLDAVHVTLDTHHRLDIAHPLWWKGAEDAPPPPFTIISVDDVESGVWRTANPALQERSLAYVHALAVGGRYPLCIWPEHCLIGSRGHGVHPMLFAALGGWERFSGTNVSYWRKGENPFTEHYSALRADVPDPTDTTTLPNIALLDALHSADRIVVAGEAGSHCVASTLRDLDALAPELTPRLILLTDAVSPVPGFERLQEDFLADLTAKGMQLSTTKEVLL
jgi:nicotinamidase-related amidase